MSLPQTSIRVTFAKPPQGSGDPAAMAAAVAAPSARMAKALTLGMQKLAFRAQKERFTGQGPFPVAQKRLGVVSGRLRRDIHAETVTQTATGYRGRIGSNVEYFGAHEAGFEGDVSVRAHTRKPHTIAKRNLSRLEQSVRAHSRRVKIPARRPLRTAIEEHATEILGAEIRKAVKP
jgi:hypothetical protein